MKKYCYNYPKPSVTTDCIIIKNAREPELLLIKRKHDPFQNLWALPGGFVEIDEDLEPGAKREIEEETGLYGIEIAQFKTFGKPGRDPRGRTISIVYYTIIENEVNIEAGDDAAKAEWFPLHELPKLAFDHNQIIEEFLKSSILEYISNKKIKK